MVKLLIVKLLVSFKFLSFVILCFVNWLVNWLLFFRVKVWGWNFGVKGSWVNRVLMGSWVKFRLLWILRLILVNVGCWLKLFIFILFWVEMVCFLLWNNVCCIVMGMVFKFLLLVNILFKLFVSLIFFFIGVRDILLVLLYWVRMGLRLIFLVVSWFC